MPKWERLFFLLQTRKNELFISGPIYYGVVTVVLNNLDVVSDEFVQEEEAIESAYMKLSNRFGLTSFEGGCQ